MEIQSTGAGCNSFRGLDYSRVLNKDKKFIHANLKKLEELGKSYDIKMVSCFVNHPDISSIDVFVMPLKNKMNFWQRLMSPKGIGSFDSYNNSIDDGITIATTEAIRRLNKWS